MDDKVRAAIMALNADMAIARERFMSKAKPFEGPEMPAKGSLVNWANDRQAAYALWRKTSGYDRFMGLAGNVLRRKHGFVPCVDTKGWRLAA